MLPLAAVPEMELRLDRVTGELYKASTSLRLPGRDTLSEKSGMQVQFRTVVLLSLTLDDEAYGRALTSMLFVDKKLRDALIEARAAANAQNLALRLRLRFEAEDYLLQALRWELLYDPEGLHLGLSERVLFSRYVASPFSHYKPPTRRILRALVAAAAPTNLTRFKLVPFDAAAVAKNTIAALQPAQVTTLASGAGPVSLARLAESLRDEPDLLCLVCHGALGDEPVLYLEDAQGLADPVTATRLLEMLGALGGLPRLLVLLACEGAGDGSYAAMAALGPQLARAGIPAVVAMQGKIGIPSALDFLASMIGELQRDGQIDRAVAAARARVRGTSDWWRPVLFMRLISGQLWIPDAAEGPASYETAPPFSLPDLFPPAESLIGRGGDLVELCNLFEQARQERKGQVAIITGRPGYGRAALARAVGVYADEQGATQITLRFWPTTRLGEEQRDALWAEDRLLTPEVAALEPQVAAAWPAAAALAGPAWVRLVAQAATILGHVPTQVSERIAEDSPRALAGILRSLARHTPFTISVEQIDLAPALWPDLLRYLLPELRRDWPALLLLTADAETEPAELLEERRGETLAWAINLAERGLADLRWLGPVSVADVADYVAPAPRGIARRLHELGDSCPTLIEAIWAEWQEQGAVFWDDEAEQWAADPDAPHVYGRLRDQAHAWLGALLPPGSPVDLTEETAASVLACAALEGRAFTAQAVAAALDLDTDAVLELCDSLVGDEEHPGLLDEVGFVPLLGCKPSDCPNVYSFSYLYLWLVWRDYGPEGDDRRTLQGRLAEALEQTYHPNTDLVAGSLIQLYNATNLLERATPYYKRREHNINLSVLSFQIKTLESLQPISLFDGIRLFELRREYAKQLQDMGEYVKSLEAEAASLAQALEWQDSEREASCRFRIGVRKTFLGLYDEAKRDQERALSIFLSIFGQNHSSVAAALHEIGRISQNQGHYVAAEKYYLQALVIEQKTLGLYDYGRMGTLHQLGWISRVKGDYFAAEDYYYQALAIAKVALGWNHPGTACILHEIGTLRQTQGNSTEAEKHVREALAIFQNTIGLMHPDAGHILCTLGELRFEQDDHTTAKELFNQAHAIIGATLGMNHPAFGRILFILGEISASEGDYKIAKIFLQQALDIFLAAFGSNHPATKAANDTLAVIRWKSGEIKTE